MIEYEALLLLAIPWVIYRLIVIAVKKQLSIKTECINAIFYFSLIFIYSLTLFPFPFYIRPHEMGEPFQLMNLIPFASIYGSLTHFYYMVPMWNIGGNILLFMPLGFALPLRYNVSKLWKVLLIGFVISLSVEVVQLFTAIRSFDVDDLILNTLGTMIGLFAYRLLTRITGAAKQKGLTKYISRH